MSDPQPDPGWPADELKAWRQHLAQQALDAFNARIDEAAQGAKQALVVNVAIRDDMAAFLALGATPTAAQVRDQVRVMSQRMGQMTQEFDGLVRLVRHLVPALDAILDPP